jgi:hypothetical protein
MAACTFHFLSFLTCCCAFHFLAVHCPCISFYMDACKPNGRWRLPLHLHCSRLTQCKDSYYLNLCDHSCSYCSRLTQCKDYYCSRFLLFESLRCDHSRDCPLGATYHAVWCGLMSVFGALHVLLSSNLCHDNPNKLSFLVSVLWLDLFFWRYEFIDKP